MNDIKPQDRYAYPAGFFNWLKSNRKVYNAFALRATRMAQTGRERYSARTIIEVMRWDTDIADSTKAFKIENNMIPGMARLWMATFGEQYPRFFAIRERS